eukprot:NODE_210_length_1169_cov_531.280230_g205_i0.p1 GENE.NODE_210_length_1169_cov_531.280230_g205_i0~~NODE_210_length_1169_cov_531.280230_g205_i0.p1  ORF type:complete len:302 (-),score=70.00 NODE_210_length_1169_cov_531.280230_g205_i0:125-1030(-)
MNLGWRLAIFVLFPLVWVYLTGVIAWYIGNTGEWVWVILLGLFFFPWMAVPGLVTNDWDAHGWKPALFYFISWGLIWPVAITASRIHVTGILSSPKALDTFNVNCTPPLPSVPSEETYFLTLPEGAKLIMKENVTSVDERYPHKQCCGVPISHTCGSLVAMCVVRDGEKPCDCFNTANRMVRVLSDDHSSLKGPGSYRGMSSSDWRDSCGFLLDELKLRQQVAVTGIAVAWDEKDQSWFRKKHHTLIKSLHIQLCCYSIVFGILVVIMIAVTCMYPVVDNTVITPPTVTLVEAGWLELATE